MRHLRAAALLHVTCVQAAGPSKYKRCAEFLVNTVVAGLAGAAARAQTARASHADKLAVLEKEAAQVGSMSGVYCFIVFRWSWWWGWGLGDGASLEWACSMRHATAVYVA
jgi:hypothetical protein